MFPSDLWITDPNAGKLFKVENDLVAMSIATPKNPRAVLVSQDMVNVYTVNWDENTISQYRHGAHAQDIRVGQTPYAICEDGNGVIYVTNYGDNTVTKIEKDSNTSEMKVTETINVHTGPRGIVADSRNKIFVSCYLSNVVDEIVNDSVVASIKVGYAPKAVTCDIYDNIWVANYGANSVSKLTSGVKILDVDLKDFGRGPSAITSNSAGVVYVANYLGNNVAIIKDGVVAGTIPVAAAPTAIDINADDAVYVTSELSGTVTKIVKDKDITEIAVCDNPSAFGDFTGCATYNVYHATTGSGSGQSQAPAGGWDITSMNLEIQQLLGKVKAAKVDTSADLVTYHNPKFATVEKALDKLMDTAPVVNSFDCTNLVYESGATVSAFQIAWNFNKPMASAVVKFNSATIADLATVKGDIVDSSGAKIITGFNVTTSGTLTVVVTDDKGVMASKALKVEFRDKFMFGAIAEGAAVGQVVLAALNKSPLLNNPYGKYFVVECAEGKTPVLAFPADWKIDISQLVFTNGFVNDWTKTTINYLNQSGGSKAYDVYVLNTVLYGSNVAGVIELLS